MNMNGNNFINNDNNMMDMNQMNNMMMNNEMMNNNIMMNNINNNMMMNYNLMNMNQMNEILKFDVVFFKELFLKLINQNMALANLLEKNNSKIKKMVETQKLDKNDYKYFNNEIYYFDISKINFFPNYNCDKINIIFENSSGLKITMFAPINALVKELLMAFYIKLQIILNSESKAIYELKDYYFIYNGSKISISEKRTISEYGFSPNSKIIFGENINIIGGK